MSRVIVKKKLKEKEQEKGEGNGNNSKIHQHVDPVETAIYLNRPILSLQTTSSCCCHGGGVVLS